MTHAARVAAAVLLLAMVACTRVDTAPERLVRAIEALHAGRFALVVEILRDIESAPGADQLDWCKVLELRALALAREGSGAAAAEAAKELFRRCPRSGAQVVGRLGEAFIDGGCREAEIDGLLADAGLQPPDCEAVHDALLGRIHPDWIESQTVLDVKLFGLNCFAAHAATPAATSPSPQAAQHAPVEP